MKPLAIALAALTVSVWTAGYVVLVLLGLLAALGVIVEILATIWRAEHTPISAREIDDGV